MSSPNNTAKQETSGVKRVKINVIWDRKKQEELDRISEEFLSRVCKLNLFEHTFIVYLLTFCSVKL